jgi:glucose-1-phosphate cytidylyltransferase
MKAVILAGGFGTRLSEETTIVPKPLVEIGGMPILWHIMKLYAHHGVSDFVICCGYKGHLIKQFFLDLSTRVRDMTVDLGSGRIAYHGPTIDDWRVTCVDTGADSMTGGRLLRIREWIGDETFLLTYGDGVTDLDISDTIRFHREQGCMATVTAVLQPGRFGALDLSSDRPRVAGFREKSARDGNLINGGYFVLEPSVFDLIDGDRTSWEQEPMHRLVQQNQLAVYRHIGYWQNMDTLRDKAVLQEQWDSGRPPWKVWT